MTLNYFDTLYSRKATMCLEGPIFFRGVGISFSSLGYKSEIPYTDLVSITPDLGHVLKATYYSLNYNGRIDIDIPGPVFFGQDGLEFQNGMLRYDKLMTLEEVRS